jgi:hypothetical protein
VLGYVGEGCGAEERRTRCRGEGWNTRGEGVYGVLAPENVRHVYWLTILVNLFPNTGMNTRGQTHFMILP